jgi:Cytidylyltransferase-like
MSKATFTFGRFNPPTEIGHGKLIGAVQAHAEKTGGQHYIFPSHTQDKKKNPLSHGDKVEAMRKMFKDTNVVSDPGIHSAIHAMQHLQRQGHDHVTMIVGSDRVENFKKLLNDYNGKEYNIKKIEVKSAGHRDPDAEGASGMSASKLRDLVKAGKRDEFISHYSNKKLGEKIHDKVHKAMNESVKAMFIMGGPGSGKDYVINNILNRFDLVEVQLDQILTGSARDLLESNANLLINAPSDMEKIELVRATLGEDYEYLYTLVSVTNKVSRERNEDRTKPMNESVRIRKWIDAENTVNKFENMFVFKNSINLKEAAQPELESFKVQIADYLGFCIGNGLVMEGTGEENDIYTKPTLVGATKIKKKKPIVPPNNINSRIDGAGGYTIGGLTQTSSVYSEEPEEMKSFKDFIKEEKPGLWANIRAKRERIKRGSGERMRKPGSEGAPTAQNFKDAANESVEEVSEATHNGREVPLNKPMKGDVKKSKVYVRDPSTGNIKKVNFGDKSLSIKSHIPARKKSYCARSGGQGNTTDKTKANYWSRRAWKC